METTVAHTGGQASNPTLLETFWHIHNPTTPNRRGWEVGEQYRSAIFFHDSIQEGLAIATGNDAERSLVKPIVTEIVPATEFYPAEHYLQRYFEKRAAPAARSRCASFGTADNVTRFGPARSVPSTR